MLQMSSEEALNKIHDMLGSMMSMYAQEDKNRAEGKSEDNVSKLIKGLIDNADNKAAAGAGQQLESLAKGMQEINKLDKTAINEIAASINTINGVLNRFRFPDNLTENIQAFVNAIRRLGDIDAGMSKNLNAFLNELNIKNVSQLQQSMDVILNTVQSLAIINKMDMSQFSKNIKELDPSIARTLTEFMSSIAEGMKSELASEEGIKSATSTLQALSILSTVNMDKLMENIRRLDPDIARQLAKFMQDLYSGLVVKKDSEGLIIATQNAMQALELLSKVDMKKVVKNIKRLDPDLAKNITDFVEAIVKRFEKIDKTKIERSIKPISNLLSAISDVISTNVMKMKISLNPIRGWLIGRQIGQFIKAIQKRIQSNNIPESIQYIGNILKPLADLADPKNKFSVFKLMKVLSTGNAKRIAGFFNALGSELKSNERSIADAMRALTDLINVIEKFEYFSSLRFAINMRLLDMKGAEKLNRFISTLMNGDWDYKRVQEMRKFIIGLILTFTSAFAILAATVALTGPVSVLAAFGIMHFGMKSIKTTIQELINGENGIGSQDMKHAVEILNQMGKTTAIMAGLIGGIAVLSEIVGMSNVLFGLGIMHLTLVSVSKFIQKLLEIKADKNITEASDAIKAISHLMLALTGSVVALTILSKISSLQDMAIAVGIVTALLAVSSMAILALSNWAGKKELEHASLAMMSIGRLIAMITLSVAALTFIVTAFSSKTVWEAVGMVSLVTVVMAGVVIGLTRLVTEKELESANKTIYALSIMLLGVTATIGILTWIIKTNDASTIWAALGIVGAVLITMSSMVVWIGTKLSEKELRWANITLAVLTGVLLTVSIITDTFLIPIGRRGGNAIMGAVITTAIVAALVGLTKWVSTFDNKDLKNALLTLGVLSGILLTVSIITKEILIPIGKLWDKALIGIGVAALTIIGLVGLTYLLTKIEEKKLHETYKTLGVLTGMLVIVSLTIRTLLIPIGENAGDAALGILIAGSTVAGMVGLVKWMTTFDEKKLHEAYKTMGILTATLLAVSFTIKYILTPIGQDASNALQGTIIAMAVVTGLVGLVKWMTTFDEKQLHEAYKSMAVLAGSLLIVSLTMKYILIPIGEQAKEALFGSAIAMAVVSGLVGLVKWMTTFDEKKLHEAYKTMAVLSGALLVVSLTMRYILIPIGQQAKEALFGSAIAMTVVTGLVGLVKWLTTFDQKELYESYKALGVLTAELLVISLTIKYVLSPIGEQAKEALFGSAIALGVVTGMVGLVKWMMTFEEQKLYESYKALGILTGELLVISMTIKYILSPIGENAKSALFGSAIAMAVVGGMIGLVKWIMTFDEKKLVESYKALGILTGELLVISLTIRYILSPIGENAKDAFLGTAIAVSVVAGMVGLVKWMMTFDEQKLTESYKALGILTAELLIVSLTIKYILTPIGAQAKEALLGTAIAIGVTIGLVGIVKVLMSFDENKLSDSYKALAVLTAELLIVSLTIKELLTPIGKLAKEALLGSAITLGVVMALVGIVRLLMTFDDKDMKSSYIALGVLTAELMVISLTLKYLVIPIGEQAKEALYGTAIVLATVMGLIGMTWLLTKIEEKELAYSAFALGVLTIILGVVALTAKYLLIPIGEHAKEALIGGAVALGIVTIMTGIVYALGKAISLGGKELELGLIKGAAVMLVSVGLIYLLGKGITPLIEAAKMAGDDPKKIAIGGAIILGALGFMTLAMVGIGKLVSNPMTALATAIGGAVLWGAIELLQLLGNAILKFTDIIEKVKKYDNKTLKDAGIGVGIVLGIMAETFIGLVALSGPALLASAVVGPIYGATKLTFMILEKISNEILTINGKITQSDIKKFHTLVYDEKNKKNPDTLIGALHNIVDGFSSLGVIASVFASIAARVIRPIIDTISKYVDVVLKVATGHYVIGYDDNGKPIYERIPDGSFRSAAISVNKSFAEFLGELNNGFKSLGTEVKLFGWLYAKTLNPVIKLVGKFVDIVLKVATSNYIVGYDDNGKPEYKHLTAQEFGAAGTQISVQFAIFLKMLNEGFKSLEDGSILAMKTMQWILFPIINHVGRFVDIVLKVATANYVTGYDANGKPEYTHLTDQDFSKAGTAVSTQFAIFIMALGTAFNGLTDKAIDAMKSVRKAMGPIMDTLSKFVDSVIKVASGSYVSGYDKNGKPEYTHIEIEDFIEAGTAVSYTFGEFIKSLNDSFSLLSKDTQKAIKTVGKALKPVMEGVANFIDSVLKFATGQYVAGFGPDKNGNYTVPILKKLTNEELVDAGKKVGEMFGYFVTSITDSFDKGGNFWGSKTEDALEAISGSIGPVMESLGTFVDAIMKVATGTYMDGYVKDSRGRYLRDKDGKLIGNIKKLKPSDFTNAAIQVAAMFVAFMDTLINEFSKSQFKEKAEDLQDIINESIKPIMDSVKAFSDSLKPFLNIKQTTTDAKGNKKDEYLAFKPGAIKQVADDIANGFASFINIIYRDVFSEEKQKNYKAIKKNAKNVSEVLDVIKKAAGSLAKIIKQFTSNDDKENVTKKSIEAAQGFNNVMSIIVDYYSNPAHDFNGTLEPAKSCLLLMKVLSDVTSKYKGIINQISSINNDDINMTELTKLLNKNMLSMANNVVNVFNAIQGVEFSKLYELISSYAMLSLKYVELSRLLNEEPQLQSGFSGLASNIHKLADDKLRRNIIATNIQITKYSNNLGQFTTTIQKSSKAVTVYTTCLEKARKTLASLDQQIIGKSKERDKALQNLADKINNIATAVDNLRNAFDALDENAIINRFDGIRELLELAGVISKSEPAKNAANNGQQSQSRAQQAAANRGANNQQNAQRTGNKNNKQNQGNTYNYGFTQSRTGHVTFQFANTILDGTFRST